MVKYNVEWSRSTWACELKFFSVFHSLPLKSHAPRERVSWNEIANLSFKISSVTLHVSVWVEIEEHNRTDLAHWVTLHVSVWVEIFMNKLSFLSGLVTLHVSVWVEMHNLKSYLKTLTSRSTWACELKSMVLIQLLMVIIVTLHVSVWVEIILLNLVLLMNRRHAPRERVSWNA